MADDDVKGGKSAETPSGTGTDEAPRRPPHTIDLKAKEIEAETAEQPDADAGGAVAKEKGAREEPSGETGKNAGRSTGEGEDKGDKSAPKRERAARPRPAPRTGPSELGGFFTHLAAGLFGGLVGVVAAGVGLDKLPLAGLTGAKPDQAAIGEVRARVAKLETRLAALETVAKQPRTDAAEALRPLQQRLARVEEALAAQQGFPAAMKDRVARLEAAIKALGEAAKKGGDVTQTAAITNQINELAARLDARIAALESRLSEVARSAITPGALNALGQQVEGLKAALAARPEAPAGPALPADLADRVAKLEKTVAALEARPLAPVTGARDAALAVALSGLRAALDSGAPYARELDAVSRLAPEETDLSALAAHAGQGVATVLALQQAFAARAEAARAATRPPKSDDTLIGRFLSNARSLVRVRRLDGAAGDPAQAALARMGAKVHAGDIAGALSEAEALPPPAKAAMGPWLDSARARLAADAAMKSLSSALAGRLAGAPADR